jgi:hypothetical protein
MPAWYFRIDGDEGGPIGQDTLLTWIMEGHLPRQALLRSEDATEWKPAEQVFPGFFPLLEQAPTGQPKGKSLVPAP